MRRQRAIVPDGAGANLFSGGSAVMSVFQPSPILGLISPQLDKCPHFGTLLLGDTAESGQKLFIMWSLICNISINSCHIAHRPNIWFFFKIYNYRGWRKISPDNCMTKVSRFHPSTLRNEVTPGDLQQEEVILYFLCTFNSYYLTHNEM